ncbi:MAG TPA: ferredoxin [Candidatus Limnocylindrales bacterium]|nr:ferredoxin [Candidatus Limnocylindrales bacterium]
MTAEMPAGEAFRISIDRDRCVGSGQCVMTGPDLFDQDDDGLVVLITEHVGKDDVERGRMAAALCPQSVITIKPSG